MRLSRLSKKCRECEYADTCEHKRMEALAYISESSMNAGTITSSSAIQTLGKIVDENAINFIVKNEKEFEAQYDLFINWNKAIIGIDFGSGRDITGYL